MKVFKVYLHTASDPHVSEMVVAAKNRKEAEERALGHVKKANPTKGMRTPKQSIAMTSVLYAREAGTEGCVVIHRVPIDVFRRVKDAANG